MALNQKVVPHQKMALTNKIYTGLCVAFCTCLVLSNLVYQKFTNIGIPFVPSFELSVGAVLYPVTFFLTDLITEFYGKPSATFCVRFAIFMNFTVVLILMYMDYLPTTSWSKIDAATFHHIFGLSGLPLVGSMLACFVSQMFDVLLYISIRKFTKGKHLWMRSSGSTAVSLFIDTTVIVSFLTACGIVPFEQMWTLIFSSYGWKLFFTVASVPVFLHLCGYFATLSRRHLGIASTNNLCDVVRQLRFEG